MFLSEKGSTQNTASCHSSSETNNAPGNLTKPAIMRSSEAGKERSTKPNAVFFSLAKAKEGREKGGIGWDYEWKPFHFLTIWLALEFCVGRGESVSGVEGGGHRVLILQLLCTTKERPQYITANEALRFLHNLFVFWFIRSTSQKVCKWV